MARGTRAVCLAVAAILIAAFGLLFGAPGSTDELFAWTIAPEATPMFMGAAYGAGAFFFIRAATAARWHHVADAFPAIAVFAALMLVATLIHWDKFNRGDAPAMAAASFYAWAIVYAISPFVVAWVWLRNRSFDDGRPDAADTEVPSAIRTLVAATGYAALTAGLVFFAAPSAAIDLWPWELTELTARVMGSFTVEAGLIAVLLSRDPRWSAWRILVQTAALGSALLGTGLVRGWADVDTADPLTWALVAGVVASCLGALALLVRMGRETGAPGER